MAKLTKEKIAISVDRPLLTLIDALVDGTTVRSRSQAIESLVRKGLSQEYVQDAIILLKKEHQQVLKQKINGKTLFQCHLNLLEKANIKQCYIVTAQTSLINALFDLIPRSTRIQLHCIDEPVPKGNVAALDLVRNKLHTNFVVLLGDTYNNFNLKKMILFHLNKNKLATVGLMTHHQPNLYSSVKLEGDKIIAFRNKKKSSSFIIDAGIYVFNILLFKYIDENSYFFEKDVLPKLCTIEQMNGYFTYGEYRHFGE